MRTFPGAPTIPFKSHCFIPALEIPKDLLPEPHEASGAGLTHSRGSPGWMLSLLDLFSIRGKSLERRCGHRHNRDSEVPGRILPGLFLESWRRRSSPGQRRDPELGQGRTSVVNPGGIGI